MNGAPYNNMNIYYNVQSNYGMHKKRDAKELSKMGISTSSINTRWQTPINQQEINIFYSQYKDFIEEAKDYRARVLGYTDEAVANTSSQNMPSKSFTVNQLSSVGSTRPKTVMQIQQEQALKYRNQQNMSAQNAYGISQAGSALSSSQPGMNQVESAASSMQDYIKRAFDKCITVSERLEMSKIVNNIIEVNRTNPLVVWSRQPLPLLPREKVFQSASGVDEKIAKKRQRLNRFKEDYSNQNRFQNKLSLDSFNSTNKDDISFDELSKKNIIVGTCTNLEKTYYRLGADPDPSKVRPEHILKQSLKMLKNKWKKKEVDYKYMESQFKSIRQDLVVQGIKSKLCVKVYEAHARVSLECGDLDHFNQCQTQLQELYDIGLKGHEQEFISYKILYLVLTDMKFEIGNCLEKLTDKQKKNSHIKHSLLMRKAYSSDNYVKFFSLYKSSNNMTPYLIDIFIDKIRLRALKILIKANIVSGISTKLVQKILAFDDKDDTQQFLEKIKAQVNKGKIDCRQSFKGVNKAVVKLRIKSD